MARQTKKTRKQRLQSELQLQAQSQQLEQTVNYKAYHRVQLEAQSRNQARFIEAVKKHEVCAAMGPAGVGKTYVATGMAADYFVRNLVDGLILTRVNVPASRTIGYLKGTAEEKMEPLLLPIIECLKRHLNPGKVKYMFEANQIEMLPFEYVRGRSFLNKFVIIDEAQNMTEDDLIAVITRYESGRVVLLGDPFQNDLKTRPGLHWLADFCQRHGLNMPITQFTIEDIVRSSFVKEFLACLYKDRELALA